MSSSIWRARTDPVASEDRGPSQATERLAAIPTPTDQPDPVDLPYGLGRRMLTIEQVSVWFAVPITTLRGLVRRRDIPYRKVGAAVRFAEAELEEWSKPQISVTREEMVLTPMRGGPRPRRRDPSRLRYEDVAARTGVAPLKDVNTLCTET